jgi:hypothetical protein
LLQSLRETFLSWYLDDEKAQPLEMPDALVIATEDLTNHKKAKEEASLLVDNASQENRVPAVLVELLDIINKSLGSKPFAPTTVSLKDARMVMKLQNWKDIVVLSGRKTLDYIRILDNFGIPYSRCYRNRD